jgi:hypothetical protein
LLKGALGYDQDSDTERMAYVPSTEDWPRGSAQAPKAHDSPSLWIGCKKLCDQCFKARHQKVTY